MRTKVFAVFLILSSLFLGCGKKEAPKLPGDRKSLKIGICPGPYGDLLKKAVFPALEKKGYSLEIVQFSDYIQPNLALSSGDIDANLFQHVPYLKKFTADKGLKLAAIVNVPTAPMSVFAGKTKNPKDIKEKASIALPNDPTNQLRALKLFQELGFIKVNPDAIPTKASLSDITENKKQIQFLPLEAAQLPRSLESTDFSAINGNFAIASGLDLTKAVILETLAEEHKNIIVVREDEKDSVFAKDIVSAVKSPEFEAVIDKEFKGFQKPEWFGKKN
ncbi:metal ABC transporter substrate-binding protein [Leptospira wolffii]|uniref:Lipoprotein n=1 Tax=Leptospira wolffii TaxID=409998 RepID=A0A2M9ZAT9_9LEPT|nr:MetQ/NlpA family ABC transporter substrate-binding protein [Leptospira wolffii]PJZ65540.1 metal ABC transporter substrate-binding protein [Leptospira wolffii]TGK56244.1 metal ABC transporter substrate-binding protein [Leptospira wolffii]TGK72291.1 metal ABC transporter substrate-binding protein [Leptospira wolffii]TGK72803.1 metal ABC transporter substrate-binding protein [Leptospira wolffii]TGL27868.1 metal ABC transporter substrate-binding protein [Leptospira wolffii]